MSSREKARPRRRRQSSQAKPRPQKAQSASRGVKRVWLRTSDDGRPLYMQMGFGDSNYLQLRGE